MPVAPSFENFEQLTEPFIIGSKYYITIKNPVTGKTRDVRWYSDTEYAKTYGPKLSLTNSSDAIKKAMGFSKGPIAAVRNNRASDEAYFSTSPARYAMGIGWYFPSTITLPLDIPSHIKLVLVSWEDAKTDEDKMRAPKDLDALINKRARDSIYTINLH